MSVFRVDIVPRPSTAANTAAAQLVALLREAGLQAAERVRASRLFLLEGELSSADAERIAHELLVDPVIEQSSVLGAGGLPAVEPQAVAFEVLPRPGVMDPVAETTLAELRAEGLAVNSVRTGRRFSVSGPTNAADVYRAAKRVLANDCVEQVVPGSVGVPCAPHPPTFEFRVRHVPLRNLIDAELEALSRSGHLFLSLDEMRAIQAHFQSLGREPTDIELETLAQTWSEHCVHKTLRSAVAYRGAPLPGDAARAAGQPTEPAGTHHYGNLLKETIVAATESLIAAGRGPRCLSVFQDNAGIIAFDDEFGVAFKVETHNHPSAIEPYGGAATGIGGVIRDVIGCGLGAKPVANTDVFCVAPADWPVERLPKGVLHPWRVLRGIVRGVADYGNRMGIPTVNGAVYFDPRYLGNPLVYCGCIGLIPRDRIQKAAQPGDAVVLIGGRTGRDGIHGATFSSAELTDTHADEFSHAVQIGNAITEKRFLDAVLAARDAAGGCLYSAITDCGAGGLSSAVGEMGEHTGAVIDLDRVPLKYAGLRYDEIWISEAQERMVVAVPPANLARFLEVIRAEEVEATVVGTFGTEPSSGGASGRPASPRLVLRYAGQIVGELDVAFLHHGLPKLQRSAEWWPNGPAAVVGDAPRTKPSTLKARLLAELAAPNVASKAWIIRQYDHEVQGGSVIKPLGGPGRGPGDAAVLRPRLGSNRGIAVASGLAPHLSDVDPYWMAAAAIDEAVRNVVSVGGDPEQTAILDNFCWGRSDDAWQLGGLVRACQACHDVALAYGTPFISGKDSLNNEFALDGGDVDAFVETLRAMAAGTSPAALHLRAVLPDVETRVRNRGRLAIPGTLLISAMSLVDDVARCISADLKHADDHLLLVGGLPPTGFALAAAATVHRALALLIQRGWLAACHDVSDGGWLVALAEMAIGGARGFALAADGKGAPDPFAEMCAAYVVETADPAGVTSWLRERGVASVALGTVRAGALCDLAGQAVEVSVLREAWAGAHA